MGIHPFLREDVVRQLQACEAERSEAERQYNEALSFGDLSENEEYQAAKRMLHEVMGRMEALKNLLQLPVLTPPNSDRFEYGSVVSIKVHEVNPLALPVSDSPENHTTDNPIFSGILLYGGSTELHTLVQHNCLDSETPVAKFLHGKKAGIYEIQVPGGYAIVEASILDSNEIQQDDLGYNYDI